MKIIARICLFAVSLASPGLAAEELSVTLPEGGAARLGLLVEAPVVRPLADPVRATGRLICDPKESAVVATHLPGQIETDTLRVGDRVKAGQTLITLRSIELAATISTYLDSEQRLRFARTALTREQELAARKLTTTEALQQKEAEYNQARIAHLAAIQPMHILGYKESDLHEMVDESPLRENLTEYRIVAPRDGVIAEKSTVPGMPVEANQKLMRIAATDPLLLDFLVPLRGVDRIRPGDKVVFRSTAGSSREGEATVFGLAPTASTDTVAASVLAGVANPKGEWMSGTPVEIQLGDPRAPLLPAVPNNAVVGIAGEPHVFVHEKGETFRAVPVKVVARTGTASGIDGLPEGARVVIGGAPLLESARNAAHE